MKALQSLLEMAKRSTPHGFYELAKKKYGTEKVKALKWPEIAAVAKENDVLIPPYLRTQKVGRGLFNVVPQDHDDAKPAPKEEPKKPSADAVKATVARLAGDAMKGSKPKEEAPKEYKLPQLEHTSYHDWSEFYGLMKKRFGEFELERVEHGRQTRDRFGTMLGMKLMVNKKNGQVMGVWDVTGSDKVPGRGFVAYGSGTLAKEKQEPPKEATKPREERKGGEATEQQMRDALDAVKNAMRNADRSQGQTWRGIEKDGKGFMFDVRDWGHWEGDDGSGDYDFQNLTKKSSKMMNDIITDVEKRYKNVKLDWQTGEKNWIYVSAK